MAFETSGIFEFQGDLEEFRIDLERIDTEKIKHETCKQIAAEMVDMVIQTLIAHPKINAPATTGPHESGPGPSIASRGAWIVEETRSGVCEVRPHPRVKQRAIVLNDGYGRIFPTGDGPLRFTVNGVPVFTEYVDGPDETQYWQAAFDRLVDSGRINKIGEEAMEREFNEVFGN